MQLARYVWIALFGLAVACGQPAEFEQGIEAEAMESTEQSLDACDASALSWSATATEAEKVCAGPFSYAMPCYARRVNSPSCGTESVEPRTCYPTCRHPDFGLAYRSTYITGRPIDPITSRVLVCVERLAAHGDGAKATREAQAPCDPKVDPSCGVADVEPTHCTWEQQEDWNTPCNTAGAAAKASIDDRFEGGVTFSTSADPGTSYCTITLYNYPTYTSSSGAQCGAGWNCDVVTYKTCRHSDHGAAVDCGPTTRFSQPASSLAQVKTEAAATWTALGNAQPFAFSAAPVCLTHQHLPIGTTAELQTQFDALSYQNTWVHGLPSGSAPAGVDNEALRRELVKRMRLLFELKGDQLRGAGTGQSDQQDIVLSLLGSYPNDTFSCGRSWTPPAIDPSCSSNETLTGLNARLSLCQSTLASHVAPSVTRLALQRWCLGTAATIAALPLEATSCNGQAYRDTYLATWLAQYEKATSLGHDASGKPVAADLQTSLSLVQQWYDTVRPTLYPGSAVPNALWVELSKTYDIFWKKVYAGTLLSSDSTQLQSVDPFNTGLMLDRAVLDAALTLPSFRKAPMLLLVGDAFRGMHERLEDFSLLHDLGCRYRNCGSGAVRTEASELWSLIGALADENTLSTALSQATTLESMPPERKAWKTLFAAALANHAALREAVQETMGLPAPSALPLLERAPAELPEPMVSLAGFIQTGRSRTDSYRNTGTFLGTTRNSLRMGIQESKQDQLNGYVTTRRNELDALVTDYEQNRNAYVSAVLAELGNSQQRTQIHARLQQQLDRFNDLSEDLMGLRVNSAFEEAAFGDFAGAFNTALAAEQADLARLAINRGPAHSLSISAAQVLYDPRDSTQTNVTKYAVRNGATAWTVAALPGDIVNIRTTGSWAPACALSRAQLRKPLSDVSEPLASVSMADAFTGPEGYIASFQNGAYSAASNSSSQYAGGSVSARACAGARVEAGAGWNFVFKAETSVYAYAEACISGEAGTRVSHDDSTGSEQRTTASYNTGIRLSETPFPRLPAGSLLAVLVEKRAAQTDPVIIRDVQVVQAPSTSIIIGSRPGVPSAQDVGVEVYLVTNDTALCTKNTTRSLDVSVQQLTPAGTSAKLMGQAMAAQWTHLRARTEQLATQGRVLPQELIALRDASISELYTQCRQATHCDQTGSCGSVCDLQQFPPSLMSLYSTFISKELARLERKVEIRSVERAMDLLAMELKAVATDLDDEDTQGRLLRLVPAWHLRNLDGTRLREGTRELASLATDFLYPVLDLRYPLRLAPLRTDAAVVDLTTTDWTLPYNVLADKVILAVDHIKTAIDSGRVFDPGTSLTQVALSFPRPGASVSNSPWRKVSGERAKAVWDVLLDPDATKPLRFSVQVTPEDLYSAGGGSAQMLCTDGSPVLHRLALYWVRASSASNGGLNNQYIKSGTIHGGEQTFPTSEGMKTYYMEDPLWRVGPTRMLFGVTDAALSTFVSQELNAPADKQTLTGDGLSPFATVEFDVSGFRTSVSPLNPHLTTDELVVVMEVERRAATSLPQPLVCQP